MTSDQDVTTEQTANKNILHGSVQSILKKDLPVQYVCMCIKSVIHSYKGPDGVQEGNCC